MNGWMNECMYVCTYIGIYGWMDDFCYDHRTGKLFAADIIY